VACKEWNLIPGGEDYDLLGMSFDNTGALGANSWRHVAFIEQERPVVNLGMPGSGPPGGQPAAAAGGAAPQDVLGDLAAGDDGPMMADEDGAPTDLRWLMSSDVCKHCTHAGCLDVCPTGALFRTE